MPESLSAIKCITHIDREAVARCCQCNQYYCRECIVEHEGDMICTQCLSQNNQSLIEKKESSGWISHLFIFAMSTVLLLFLFYSLGWFISIIPDSFDNLQAY